MSPVCVQVTLANENSLLQQPAAIACNGEQRAALKGRHCWLGGELSSIELAKKVLNLSVARSLNFRFGFLVVSCDS